MTRLTSRNTHRKRLVGALMDADNKYSHRLHDLGPYTIHQVQAIVAHEDLMLACCDLEDDGEGADTFVCKIFPPIGVTDVEPLIEFLAGKMGAPQIIRGSHGTHIDSALFVSDAMVLTLCRDHDTAIVNRLVASKANCTDASFADLMGWMQEAGWSVGHDWEDNEKVPVSFAYPSKSGVHIMSRSFTALPLSEIEMNYNTHVIEEVGELIEALQREHNGIAIINGPSGTGKSYLIRAILTELRKARHPLICTPPSHFLTNMGDLTEAVISATDEGWGPSTGGREDPPGTLVVMEDVGEMLVIENVTTHVDETANLLNMSDGIMALMSDTVFIVTFNHDIGAINPALTRPGRCLGRITVDKLPYTKALSLVELEIPVRAYTLAEVYEMRRTGKPVADTEKKSSMRV